MATIASDDRMLRRDGLETLSLEEVRVATDRAALASNDPWGYAARRRAPATIPS